MFGFLKNILAGKSDEHHDGGHARVTPQTALPASAPATGSRAPASPATIAAPPAPLNAVANGYPGTGTGLSNGGSNVQLPLHAVLNGLPAELQTKVRQSGASNATVSISLEQVLTQLPQGSVRITFGELRQAVPTAFSRDSELDHVQVSLPLNEILLRMNPALLVRRQNQKQVQVPEEIRSPFGGKGDGLIFSMGPSKTETTASVPARSVTPMAPVAPKSTPVLPVQSKPAPTLPIQPRPAPLAPGFRATPVSPAPIQPRIAPVQRATPVPPSSMPPAVAPAIPFSPEPAKPVPFRGSFASTPTPPPPVAPPASPIMPAFRGMGATSPAPATPGELVVPRMPVSRESVPQPARAAGEMASLSVSLIALIESWPEVVRQEIIEQNLMEAKIALPVETVEQSLRRGKVSFPWKMLRSWIRPAPLPSVSAHDNSMLDLPLNVIAPLFLNRHKDAGKAQQKVAVDENIPNLFFGFPQPSAPPEAEVAADGSHAVTKPVDTNYYVWDDNSDSARVDETEFKRKTEVSPGTNFVTRCATPNEVVSRAAALEGVAGALIALPDGLMVASRLAPDLNGDTLAAFLPHIFGKVSQCTRELRMGELNNLNFTVGNVPWKIFRVNAIFFAAFGRPGHPLPTAQLVSLAAELDRKKQ